MDKIVLKKADSIQEMERKLLSVEKKGAGFDAHKYCGTIKLKEDPVEYQKKVRKEWE